MNRVLPTEIFYQPTDLSEAWVLVPHRQGLTMFCGKSHKSPDIVGGRVRTEQQENISSPGIKHTFLKGNKTCHVPAIRQLRVVSPCIAARVVLSDADRWHYRLFDVDRFVGTGRSCYNTHLSTAATTPSPSQPDSSSKEPFREKIYYHFHISACTITLSTTTMVLNYHGSLFSQ